MLSPLPLLGRRKGSVGDCKRGEMTVVVVVIIGGGGTGGTGLFIAGAGLGDVFFAFLLVLPYHSCDITPQPYVLSSSIMYDSCSNIDLVWPPNASSVSLNMQCPPMMQFCQIHYVSRSATSNAQRCHCAYVHACM